MTNHKDDQNDSSQEARDKDCLAYEQEASLSRQFVLKILLNLDC